MLWSMMRLIFKTSSVTPNFFYVFYLILSFSTCSESFEKICAWELLGANILKSKQKKSGRDGVSSCTSNKCVSTAFFKHLPDFFNFVMVIELHVMQFGLKSYVRFHN